MIEAIRRFGTETSPEKSLSSTHQSYDCVNDVSSAGSSIEWKNSMWVTKSR